MRPVPQVLPPWNLSEVITIAEAAAIVRRCNKTMIGWTARDDVNQVVGRDSHEPAERDFSMMRSLITDIPGIRVGHAHNLKLASGVTAFVLNEPVVAGVDVRGGGPRTRETDLLDPEHGHEHFAMSLSLDWGIVTKT